MQIILFDNLKRKELWPLTATKSVADLRCGILTIKERWEARTKYPVFVITEEYLQNAYTAVPAEEAFIIDATVFADDALLEQILALQTGEALADEDGLVAGVLPFLPELFKRTDPLPYFNNISKITGVKRLQKTWQLFQWNDEILREDFKLITKGRASQPVSPTNFIHQQADIFIEEGARVEFAFLNSTTGPIYIGKDAEIWEGAVIRGPFALGHHAVIKAGAKIYGATTIGPWSAAGGEIKNAVISGYSNKAHDGYLGDSVIGEWCNLGAGTTNSNVKNTAANVKLWNAFSNTYEGAGVKAGVIMGDYTRVAINSSINTGSVFGVSANIFGNGLLPTLIDSFVWGIDNRYDFEKALQAIDNWKKFKHSSLSAQEISVLKHIFEQNKH